VLETRAEIELDLGFHERLVPELVRFTAEFPLRERLRYLLILALYRCGRQAEALAAYREARDFLAEEFGVEPGERLQQLQLSILRSDPALATAPGAANPLDVSNPQRISSPPNATVDARERLLGPSPQEKAWTPVSPPAFPTDPSYGPERSGLSPAAAISTVSRSGRARQRSWLVTVAAAALTVVSVGALASAFVAYFAGRRRSPKLGLAAAGYLVLSFVFWTEVSAPPQPGSAADGVTLVAFVLSTVGGAVHVALLMQGPGPQAAWQTSPETAETPSPHPQREQPPDPAGHHPVAGHAIVSGGGYEGTVEALQQRARREQARTLLEHDPDIARDLRIGRPDLPRWFDDGGLVDINGVPEHVLAVLPGITAHHAERIVADRQAHGDFATVDDLTARGLLPVSLVHILGDVLVAAGRAKDAG
jgi:hypothetical protein